MKLKVGGARPGPQSWPVTGRKNKANDPLSDKIRPPKCKEEEKRKTKKKQMDEKENGSRRGR